MQSIRRNKIPITDSILSAMIITTYQWITYTICTVADTITDADGVKNQPTQIGISTIPSFTILARH